MKIQLKYPYNIDYKAGYLNTNKEPRRVVLLVRNNGTKTSTSYARYLMSCHLKRYLLPTEHVDHIDNNKLNDIVENLQILSQAENNKKCLIANNIRLADPILITCPVCNKKIYKPARNVKYKIKQGKKPCCSRKCGGTYSHRNK